MRFSKGKLGLLCVALLVPLILFFRTRNEAIVFAEYNLENYNLGECAGPEAGRPKSQESIQALLAVIKEINPDILGICEMGSPEAFEDFKLRLAKAGLHFIDFEYVTAADPDRHLALLSRFPILKRESRPEVCFNLGGERLQVRRGFLDVTVDVGWPLRLVGAHLKSKLPAKEGETLLRRHEAHLLRQHIDGILQAQPGQHLLVYGDFNDTKNEHGFQEICGRPGSPGGMADLWLRDKLGDRWTHYWKSADIYSRIDYILVNRALMPHVDKAKSYVYRSAFWERASDHRPIVTLLRPEETR